jgi:transposase
LKKRLLRRICGSVGRISAKEKHSLQNQCKIFPRQNHQHTDLAGSEDLALAGTISKESIDFLTRLIKKNEAVIEDRVELNPPYEKLQRVFGIGKMLALTIMLETGPISRFAKIGNYVSSCCHNCILL